MNLLEARGLKKYFPLEVSLFSRLAGEKPGLVRAVDGVTFAIKEGEVFGLVGESGSGKSTLGRTIVGLYEPTDGEVLFEGAKVVTGSSAGLRKFRLKAQMIFQNPYSSLNPRKTIRQILEIPLKIRKVPKEERKDELASLIASVGLANWHLDQYPHQFSGGQRQRISIARALAMRPKFIVADEPVSSLDVSIQAQVINLLKDLQESFSLTYLFIAHDVNVVYYISDRMGVMYLGRIVELGKSDEIVHQPQHPYTRALLSAVPEVSAGKRRQRIILEGTVPSPLNPPKGCVFHPRCPEKKGAECKEVAPVLKDAGGGHLVACHRV
jgi:peptide/nickel transport system ATP-binding protein/oligopeptide transport system ATP-binding protein